MIFPHFQWNPWYTLSTNEKESGFEHYHLDTRWGDGSSLGLAFNRNYERLDKPFEVFPGITIPPGKYPYSEAVLNYGTDPSARFFLMGNLSAGNFYSGNIRTINTTGGYRKGQNLTWTGAGSVTSSTFPLETSLRICLVSASIGPSRPSDFQTFAQYNSSTHQFSLNSRLVLLNTSSTGLFVVYNTRASTVDFLDPHEQPRSTMSRALFIKFNYLFDF
jgi:hypothetical protein